MSAPDATDVRLDARNLRGIAHPLRVRLLRMLRAEGPATASMLARRLDLSTGATSYHLRQLAQHGFIEDVPARGERRERWWRAAHSNTVVPDDVHTEAGGAAVQHSLGRVWADNLLHAIQATPALSPAWRAAQDFSDYAFRLTPGEAKALAQEIHQLLRRHSLPDAPRGEDAALVTVQFQMFPTATES
jgi:DNA-binding transcriptional ArsR family regulator